LALLVLLVSPAGGHAAEVVDTLLNKYQNAGQALVGALKNAATSIFWILATISLSWTCISMAIKHAEMGEFFAELCRFLMFTGLFFWLLTNGPQFANDVITSLRTVGGEAAGTGKAIYPAKLINLGMQVFQNTIKHINFLQPESIVAPIIIALIILIVCALIAVNMILLLCAAWVVLYAGIIFLGFGGCRWTSDMAINYYRTVLGVGVSLMTMELIIGIGIEFLKEEVASTAQNLDAGALAIIMIASIILLVIAHRLPQMVAGMVVGGGNNGAIGGVGIMTLLGTAVAGTSIVGSAAAAASTAGASTAAAESHKLLLDRIAAAEAAIAAGSSNGNVFTNTRPDTTSPDAGLMGPGRNPTGTDTVTSHRPATASQRSPVMTSPAGKKTATGPAPAGPPEAENPDEPPLTRPMTPDEQRGFPPPTDPPEWQK
jgi:type IV secretion system protein VirB6/type IV secretion system protein TrbL